ncbi:MAG: DUF2782 domain-containing protein [Pseudomonadales bacterium]
MKSGEKLPYQPVARLILLLALLAGARTTWAEDVRLSVDGPDVTIIASEERTVYEFRQNGQLRMVRVVPKWGKPYYLVPADPTKGYGDLERADMLLPSWVIAEF